MIKDKSTKIYRYQTERFLYVLSPSLPHISSNIPYTSHVLSTDRQTLQLYRDAYKNPAQYTSAELYRLANAIRYTTVSSIESPSLFLPSFGAGIQIGTFQGAVITLSATVAYLHPTAIATLMFSYTARF
jgi:hypothetical protein